MDLMSSMKKLEKYAIDNSPGLLTAVGVAGVVGTALLTYRAATRSTEKLVLVDARKHHLGEDPLTTKEIFKITWKAYIPPVVAGGLTIGAVIFANHIGTKRAAAMAAAYALSEKAFTEYRDKVKETVGENKERKLSDELAQDKVNRNPMNEGNLVVMSDGDVICCDLFTGRYFRCTADRLKKAENDTNHEIIHNQYATLTEFYERIGLPRTDISDSLGWNFDELLSLEITAVLVDESTPCLAFSFRTHPIRDYRKLF